MIEAVRAVAAYPQFAEGWVAEAVAEGADGLGEDLLSMRYEEEASALERLGEAAVVDGGHDGFAGAGGGNQEVAVVAVLAGESVFNPDFDHGEFATIRSQAGLNSYKISVKEWVERTGAIGLKAAPGRYGGTFAHPDIAFEFGMWISPEFKIYLVKEFRRLKEDENRRLSLAWNLNRTLSRLNYRIHTDAIKAHLIPPEVTPAQAAITYATEADLLNVALFGQTARQWRAARPDLEGNIREYATVEQLLVLANIEGMNAELIHMGLAQGDRLKRLNQIAIRQMQALTAHPAAPRLTAGKNSRL